MKFHGVNYDIGTNYSYVNTREFPTPDIIKKDISSIRNDLNCNSIRIYGQDSYLLLLSAEMALDLGLNVWISPRLINASVHEILRFIEGFSPELEKLRVNYPKQKLVFIIGCELTIDAQGFVEGETVLRRSAGLFNPVTFVKNSMGIDPGFNLKLNLFLDEAVKLARSVFEGEITYASGYWERINWTIFDIVSVNYYRAAYNKAIYAKNIRSFHKHKKPVAITGFGCCCYQGAEQKGAGASAVVDWEKQPPRLQKPLVRNEHIQASHLIDLLRIFKEENVEAAFTFTFVETDYKYHPDPKYDLDMASFGIVKTFADDGNNTYPVGHWEPKPAFFEMSKMYKTFKKLGCQ